MDPLRGDGVLVLMKVERKKPSGTSAAHGVRGAGRMLRLMGSNVSEIYSPQDGGKTPEGKSPERDSGKRSSKATMVSTGQ